MECGCSCRGLPPRPVTVSGWCSLRSPVVRSVRASGLGAVYQVTSQPLGSQRFKQKRLLRTAGDAERSLSCQGWPRALRTLPFNLRTALKVGAVIARHFQLGEQRRRGEDS